jgi:hypothetical protein
MATERQISANRANAKHSTGPKTGRGRGASSRNALRHGLSCSLPKQPFFSIDIDELVQALIRPGADETESEAVHAVVTAHLELQRVRLVRAELLASLDPSRGTNFVRKLLTLERYERAARGRRRRAAKETIERAVPSP